MHAVQLKLKPTQEILYHDAKVVIKDPGAQASQMLPLGFLFQ